VFLIVAFRLFWRQCLWKRFCDKLIAVWGGFLKAITADFIRSEKNNATKCNSTT
jgi:hypothetical protein